MNILWLESSKTKNYFQRNDVNIVKVIFYDVIRCSFGVYNSILLKSSIKIFDIPNAPIHMNYYRKDSFFKGTKTSKNKNIEPHQSFTNFTEALVRQSKLTEKHQCQSLFLNKVACNFSKKGTLAQVFSWEFYKIVKTTFFDRILPVAAYVLIYKKVYTNTHNVLLPLNLLCYNIDHTT